MRRRDVLRALTAMAACAPQAGGAEPGGQQLRVGVLVVGGPDADKFWRVFRAAMRELGYVEGRNVAFEFRSDDGRSDRLPELAAELVRLQVDVIVTWFTPAAVAAKRATRDIPIVIALSGDPVATGLVESLSHPGGNITGIGGLTPELAGKTVEFLREMLPAARRATALANAPDPFSRPFLDQVRAAGAAAGLSVRTALVRDPAGLDADFNELVTERPDVLIVQPSLPSSRTAGLALRHRLPAACSLRSFVDAGGLMSYWFAEEVIYRRAAAIVDMVLKGARPAEIPIEQPSTFELVLNLGTARTLGLRVPPSLLARADEVIE